jgi:hypothetical protein
MLQSMLHGFAAYQWKWQEIKGNSLQHACDMKSELGSTPLRCRFEIIT